MSLKGFIRSKISGLHTDQKDSDEDGIGNACDNCPNNYNREQEDKDNDGVGNKCDNCPDISNPDQKDSDKDGIGDTCEIKDYDQDGIPDEKDNCPLKSNKDQADEDKDGVGDVCDNCPSVYNPDQKDKNQNGIGDVCEIKDSDLVIDHILCDEWKERIGYEIKNIGRGVAPLGHKTVLLVNGQIVDDDEVNISLEPGETYQGYFEDYEWTSSTVITICADHYDVVAEADEDNCRRGECVLREEAPPPTKELPALPDLMIDPYSPFSYSPHAKEFYYTVWNNGDVPALSTVTEVYIDGVKVAEQRIGPLKAHEKRRETIPYDYSNCPICTEHRIEIRLDAGNEVLELSEHNNQRFKDIRCSFLFLPDVDLAVEDIRFDAMSGRIGFTLSNRGSGESQETEAHLWVDNQLVESRHIASLVGGDSREEYFDHRWQCESYEDNIKVWVEPVVRRVEDCSSGVEIELGELDYRNNWAEDTWDCPWPDLVIERAGGPYGSGEVTYLIKNQGRSSAGPSVIKLYCDLGGRAVASEEVPALEPGESWEGAFPGLASDYCALPSEGWATIYLKADSDDAITELNEVNNWRQIQVFCGHRVTPGVADLSVERIWFNGASTTPCLTTCQVCFEIKNVGALSVGEFIGDVLGKDTTKTEVEIGCRYRLGIYELRVEPDLAPGESRIICYDLSAFGDWCGCEKLFVRVEVDNSWDLAKFGSPKMNDNMSTELENRCANGIQDQGEEGIDCDGPCPASCRDCFADADYGSAENAGYFKLNSPSVQYHAQTALEEYANCLMDASCRSTLESYNESMDFSTITVEDLAASTDYIMEAVAYYIDKHTTYMYDDDGDVSNAEEMLIRSRERSGKLGNGAHVDTCPTDFCGDCEDHAIVREALMRVLGVSWRCAYCADHYDGYWGGGHTFNLVYYRNKWRIMDYGSLGHYFSIRQYWNEHDPNNAWNDHVGEYWCPEWKSDPACWFCCNHNPPRNYDGGERCDSYYRESAP